MSRLPNAVVIHVHAKALFRLYAVVMDKSIGSELADGDDVAHLMHGCKSGSAGCSRRWS
jgi:hypothetical protein